MFYPGETAIWSFSGQKTVWTYSFLDENKFGLFQSWMIDSMRLNAHFIALRHWDNMS